MYEEQIKRLSFYSWELKGNIDKYEVLLKNILLTPSYRDWLKQQVEKSKEEMQRNMKAVDAILELEK